MRPPNPKISKFLSLPTDAIVDIINRAGMPNTGIFVPEGNRRMVMTKTGLRSGTSMFYLKYVDMCTNLFMNNLEVLFSHGLKNLIVPLVSPSVLKRDDNYIEFGLGRILSILFTNMNWKSFYSKHNIRVKFYGDLTILNNRPFQWWKKWMENIESDTSSNSGHLLLIGIASNEITGVDIVNTSLSFFEAHNRKPTLDELKHSYYGENIATADFFIMSTKMSGVGALPPLITSKKTQLYYLVSPGVMSLTKTTFRKILYDLIYMREPNKSIERELGNAANLKKLNDFYTANQEKVIGLGRNIEDIWVPEI